MGLPNIQCPSCQYVIDCSGRQIEKLSKTQRERRYNTNGEAWTPEAAVGIPRKRTSFDGEDEASEFPENAFLVVSCGNERCQQYNKLKVLRIPRIHTPSIKVDLS